MKAVFTHKDLFGSKLAVGETSQPQPNADDVLIKVHHAGLNPLDWKLHKSGLRYLPTSRIILGRDVAGTVEAVGHRVTDIKPGDLVYTCTQAIVGGAYAEYVTTYQKAVALMPNNLTFAQAAAVPLAALTAYQGLQDARIHQGKSVLIIGASGGVGTFAVQMAKHSNTKVTAVCSGRNESLVKELGADKVIDYTKEDFHQCGEKFDIVFDALGYESAESCEGLIVPNGYFVTTMPNRHSAIDALTTSFPVMKDLPFSTSKNGVTTVWIWIKPSGRDLNRITSMIEGGTVRPVIDKIYPMAALAEAFAYNQEGRTRGKIVIAIAQ